MEPRSGWQVVGLDVTTGEGQAHFTSKGRLDGPVLGFMFRF